jgi:subtilisin family serine protease
MKPKSITVLAAIFLLTVLSTSSLIFAAGPDRTPPEIPAPLSVPQQALDRVSLVTKDDISKLSPLLNQVYKSQQKIGIHQAADSMKKLMIAEKFIKIVAEGRPGKTDEVSALLHRLGGHSVTSYRNFLFATFPIDRLPELGASSSVHRVRTPSRSYPDALTEGRDIHNATAAHAAGHTGQGVKVGVLDCDGFAGYEALLETDLPAAVTLWNGGETGDPVGTGNHGTACAETVYDMAPGAQYFLAHDATEADFYQAVDWFIAQGVRVVSYSCSGFGPYPNDGLGLPHNPVNAKVSEARANNILWVNSGGNDAYKDAYHGTFTTLGLEWHNFGEPYNGYNPIYINASSGAYVTLTWNDWPADPTTSGSTQDYDLYIYDGSWNILASSTTRQDGTIGRLPFEEIDYTPSADGWYNLVIVKHAATGNHFLNLKKSQSGSFVLYSPDKTIKPPAESPDALAVGALFWKDLTLEPFSSRGPTLGPGGSENGGSVKPDLAAVDGVSTVTYGPSDGVTWLNGGHGFFGTSAACPHVAGAAAVYFSKFPGSTADQIENRIFANAVDLGNPGLDNLYGYGKLFIPSPLYLPLIFR